VKIVDAFPDLKVQIDDAFPDLKVQVVDWADVYHTPKGEKVGSKKDGAKQEWKMFQDMVRVLSPFGIIRQHWGLMRLAGVFFFKTLNLLIPPLRARA